MIIGSFSLVFYIFGAPAVVGRATTEDGCDILLSNCQTTHRPV